MILSRGSALLKRAPAFFAETESDSHEGVICILRRLKSARDDNKVDPNTAG